MHSDISARWAEAKFPAVRGRNAWKRQLACHRHVAFTIQYFEQLRDLKGHRQWRFPAKHNDGHVGFKVVSKQVCANGD